MTNIKAKESGIAKLIAMAMLMTKMLSMQIVLAELKVLTMSYQKPLPMTWLMTQPKSRQNTNLITKQMVSRPDFIERKEFLTAQIVIYFRKLKLQIIMF